MPFQAPRWARLALVACATMVAGFAQVSFTKDVAPILRQHCVSCHGAAQQMSSLDLRTRDSAIKGGRHGAAITPGKPGDSILIRRITSVDQPGMPLGGKLADREIATLRQWIGQGAPWEGGELTPIDTSRKITANDRRWWAFQKPVRHPLPKQTRNPIDAFLQAKLEEKQLTPVGPADRRTWIRRAYLDLTGLLPTPEAIEAFVNDRSANAYDKVAGQLLGSAHYGERWGRHWLDVARYADSGGYEQDFNYPNAWRYRDYVIRAFNNDKPYDQFIREQLAGDELDKPDFDALIATGFNRVLPTVGFREADNPQYRYTYLDDLIATTSKAFLGVTVGCARCHDHKFDPIKQMDYYRMMAFFNPYIHYDFPLAQPDVIAKYNAQKAAVDAKVKPLKAQITEIEAPYRKLAFEKLLATYPQDIQAAVHTPEEKRTEGQKLLATQVLTIRPNSYRELMDPGDRKRVAALQKEIKQLEKDMPAPLPLASGIRDGDYRFTPPGPGDEEAPGKGKKDDNVPADGSYVPVSGKAYQPPATHFLERGDYLAKGAQVEPGFPEIFDMPAAPTAIPPKDDRITTGRRRALAEWIASKENPLTARVMVNRIWHHHFGRGLSLTVSNFGKMGRRPSHPELLDWLADEFMRSGWSVKHIHWLIMSSDAYRRASQYEGEANLKADPENTYLWHFPQRRLEGEAIRDIILQASGNLNLQAGGAPFFPPVPDRVLKSVAKGIWTKNEEGPEVWRRSVYSYFKRGMRYPMFEVFDQPDPNATCEGRNITTVPTQALTLLNNEFVVMQARAFAERVRKLAGPEQSEQVKTAYRIALGREPSVKELDQNTAFVNRTSLADLCDVILNLNEFLYVN